jgi:immune inhibitor A
METSSSQSSNVPKIVGAIVAILVCCSCVAIIAAGVIGYQAFNLLPPEISTAISPTEEFTTPVPIPTLERPPTDSISTETLDTLSETLVPENDPYELGCRLERICNVPETVQGKTYQVGDQEKFWVLNSDAVEYHQIDATLLYVTPHTYFWAEDGAEVNQSDMKALMDTFENKIYPTDREFFGSEWTPGVDGDPHIYVIYASGLGESIAGLFNSTDELNPQIEENSNGHETFMLSTTQDLADEYTYSTLAHEFVHMIQFPADRNDATWMTEGFAEVGAFLNGYGVGGWDWAYAESPDLQLTDWSGDIGSNGTHYGQSFLYLAYFLDRFGEEATKALTNNPENDLASVDDTLAQLNITDPQTGQIITADDVFMDWAAALYLKDERIGDGRYTYHNFPNAPQASDTDVISDCLQSALDRSVNQYGIDYVNVTCTGDFTLHFRGSTVARLLPVDAHSGAYAFWSNKGDESNMTLTREFDFTNAAAPIKLSYWTWYDIEKDWDYLHLAGSTDGRNWEIITTPSGTDYDPSGASYGWSYTGQSNDWTLEEIDISQFAGRKVQIRFEYITDAAVNGEGFMLDDVRVDAINYQSDFEADDGGWEASGFARVENVLPQTYRLALITKGDTTTVTQIPLDPDETVDIPLSLKSGEEAVLIVAGTTRFTRLPAAYQIEIK